VSERELYAIRYGLFKARPWVQGHPDVTVWSDHLNLVTGLWTHTSAKIERWRLFIEAMQPFKLKHIRGTSELQSVADCLSRLHMENLVLAKTADEEDPESVFWADRGEGEGIEESSLVGPNAPTRSVACVVQGMMQRSHELEAGAQASSTLNPQRAQECAKIYGRGATLLQRMGWSDNTDRPLPRWPQEATGRARPGVGYGKQASKSEGEQKERGEACCMQQGADEQESAAVVEVTCNNIVALLGIPADAVRSVKRAEYVADRDDIMAAVAALTCHHEAAKEGCGLAQDLQETEVTKDVATQACAEPACMHSMHGSCVGGGGRTQAARDCSRSTCNSSHQNPPTHTHNQQPHPQPTFTHLTQQPLPACFNERQRAAITRLQEHVKQGDAGKREGNRSTAVHAVMATQTDTEDLRRAANIAKGGFPHKELLRLVHDDTHPCFTVTWKRIVRATGVQLGEEGAALKEECRRFCDTCLVCQKLQPAKERVSSKLGVIRSRPFSQLAFDLIVLIGSEDAEGHRFILSVTDSFSHCDGSMVSCHNTTTRESVARLALDHSLSSASCP
jgi:hypothetical protein